MFIDSNTTMTIYASSFNTHVRCFVCDGVFFSSRVYQCCSGFVVVVLSVLDPSLPPNVDPVRVDHGTDSVTRNTRVGHQGVIAPVVKISRRNIPLTVHIECKKARKEFRRRYKPFFLVQERV
jgi:hypothetical protein